MDAQPCMSSPYKSDASGHGIRDAKSVSMFLRCRWSYKETWVVKTYSAEECKRSLGSLQIDVMVITYLIGKYGWVGRYCMADVYIG